MKSNNTFGVHFVLRTSRIGDDSKVVLDYSRPGKPTDNPFTESFNGSFRDECLNVNWFLSLDDAYEKINHLVHEYNYFRPHSSLNGLTPSEVVGQYEQTGDQNEHDKENGNEA
jgi:putative transposase